VRARAKKPTNVFTNRLVALILGLCVGTASFADPITHTITENNTNFTSAGVSGIGSVGTGTITLAGVTGSVETARLYWHGIDSTNYDNPTVSINGNEVTGVAIGTASTNCWGSGNSVAYQADVSAYVAADGAYTITGLASGAGHSANGASLVVTFDDGNSNNDRDIAFFEGNDSNFPGGFPGEDAGWHAVLTPINYDGASTVGIQLHGSDGQNAVDGTLVLATVNGSVSILDDNTLWDGVSLPDEGSGRGGHGLHDIHDFDITAAFGAVQGSVDLTLDGMETGSDCLGLILALVDFEAGSLEDPDPDPPVVIEVIPVPTLDQYGLAALVILMLGIGFVGLRRIV